MSKSGIKLSKKKLIIMITSIVLCVAIVGGIIIALFAGGKKKDIYDTETRPLVFSTDALDGNFNPFFATSATDVNIAAMTQVSMLSTDRNGQPLCGENNPTVALDYKQTMYDVNGDVTTDGNKASKENGGSTVYEFLIKNGMKFSDGKPLTIQDVLFNLYVYLDPAYMGSATIYSTDIKGLNAYRSQDPTMSDSANVNLDTTFYATADQRISDLLAYLVPETGVSPVKTEQITADIATLSELFREEVESDWTSVAGTVESYEKEYSFTEDWEIYYFNEGIIQVQYEIDGTAKKDAEGKYITNLDLEGNELRSEIEAVKKDSAKISAIMSEKNCTEAEAKEYAIKDFAIDTVYNAYTLVNSKLAEIVMYWASGSNLRDEIAAEARTEYFANLKAENEGALMVQTISGITTYTTKNFNGKSFSDDHYVLKIEINGVDPKAIWNFAFTVSPMHYYSGGEALAAAQADKGTTSINGVQNQFVNFCVSFSDSVFFDSVLQAPQKNGLPVGAGVYKASNAPNANGVNKDTFYMNNWVYFERNTYFESMGEGISNANIKYLRYKVVGSDKILQALETGDIDIGSPQATADNIATITNVSHLNYKQYTTNGYGYVGVNPKFVPDIEVRQAIMKAMDTASIIKNYYTEALADVIYRPMSTESWAYPKGAQEWEEIAFTTEMKDITDLVESAGWKKGSDGIYAKNGKKLKLTFTIAGESTDHPAYEMFMDAANTLNSCGFDITVATDITALKKLATGGLAVWAAAWSATIDPDLYQVYHKDSKATSIKNWGYETIYADSAQFGYEQSIIDALSEQIEQARATIDQSTRESIYSDALDNIMKLAIELPTYQRNDLVVYNKNVIDASSLESNPNAYVGVYDRLWEVNYN